MAPTRITVSKNDEATVIAEKIIDAKGDAIVLIVPRFSKIGESASNFRLLKREADALGKNISIETVDEDVIKGAEEHGISCTNPFFSQKRFSDIVTSGAKEQPSRESPRGHHEKEISTEHHLIMGTHPTHRQKPGRHSKKIIILSVAVLAIAAGIFIATTFLPKADIVVVIEKDPRTYQDSVVVDKNVSSFSLEDRTVPGQLFRERKNLQLTFPAEGKKQVATKATGSVTLYNAYGTAPQSLVATTRLQSPDGKIFRLVHAVTIPGATIVQGKIVPSSIEAAVIADKAGADYNIGPVEKFTIPGFSGSPKFSGFYASSVAAMKGGFVGEGSYATDADIKKAKAQAADTLLQSMKGLVLAELPADFKILEEAIQFKIIDQTVGYEADAQGQLTLSTEAEISGMAFRERDVVSMFLEKVSNDAGTNFVVKEYSMEYGAPRFNTKGQMSFSATLNGVLEKPVDLASLKEKILGRTENDLKAIIFGIPGIKSATVSLWPFWVRKVPKNMDRITISLD